MIEGIWIVPGFEKNQRTMAQKTRRRGIAWIAFSANLRRDSSFLATYESGSYVGNCWSVSVFARRLWDCDGVESIINCSATRKLLVDLSILRAFWFLPMCFLSPGESKCKSTSFSGSIPTNKPIYPQLLIVF